MDKLAALLVIIAAALWGVDGIVLRPALYTLPVPLVVFIESGVVALILLPFFRHRTAELKKLRPKDWLAFIGVALFGGAIGTMAITKALFYVNYVNLSIVILIQKLQPVFAIILAAILLKERPSKRFAFYAFTAIIGAYFMTFGLNFPRISAEDKTTLAAVFALIATISFAASTVLSKRALRHVEFKLATFLRFFITTLVMTLIIFSSGHLSAIPAITGKQALIFLIIVFSTGGPAIFLYYYGLKRISASVATICELSFPLTAVILEYWLRDNLLNPVQWGGVIILFLSIMRVSQINARAVKRLIES